MLASLDMQLAGGVQPKSVEVPLCDVTIEFDKESKKNSILEIIYRLRHNIRILMHAIVTHILKLVHT